MAAGKLSAVELMAATLDRIEAVNPDLVAIVALRDRDALMAEAAAADRVPVGQRGPLHGLPIAIKDFEDVAGLPTRGGSRAFPEAPVKSDGLMVSRLRKAGAIFTGKTNVPELGLGSHTFNLVYGTTSNPYDQDRSCGGSSGGAAVALAMGMQTISDGSDMMGSLRNPVAWNNVYGFRPSVGLIPAKPQNDVFLHKIVTLGPMARSVKDIALLLDVQAGPDARFPHQLPKPDLDGLMAADMAGKRIGWLGDWGGELPFEDGILGLCEQALGKLSNLGAKVEALEPLFSRDAIWQSWLHLRAFGIAVGYGELLDDPKTRDLVKDDARWEIEMGRSLSAMDIQKASLIRSKWFQRTAELFDTYDALIIPSAQVWPFPQHLAHPTEIAGVQMDTYHRWMEVVLAASLIGLPSLSVPVGFGENGLPMGMQIIGRYGEDRKVLEIGQAWHEATDWPNAQPPKIHQ